MNRTRTTYGLLLISLISACSTNTTTNKEKLTGIITEANNVRTSDSRSDDLQKQIERIAATAKGRVGVAAVVLETGEGVFC
jgi:hypothetical protein